MDNDKRNAMRHDFLAWCEKERTDASVQLERFKSGMLKIGLAGPAGYVDGSAALMEQLQRIIANMDELIPKVRADLGDINSH